jgi:hypothetical protein
MDDDNKANVTYYLTACLNVIIGLLAVAIALTYIF